MDKFTFRAIFVFLCSLTLLSVLFSAAGCGGGDDSCADDKELCGDECVDLQTNVEHCGECFNACPEGENEIASCFDGECEAECEDGFYDCDDEQGCESEEPCPEECADDEELCGDECVDLQTNVEHCGECFNACPEGENQIASCSDGECEVECEDGFYDCDDEEGCESEEPCSGEEGDEEICDNDEDDDGDGYTDCEDRDCDGEDDCEYREEKSCDDGFDNDADGKTDCEDNDCEDDDACAKEPERESDCDDGEDNDADGKTDCEDRDCDGKDDCEYGDEESCDDNVDNDADGDTDCEDFDCNNTDGCEYGEEDTCDDGFDNDADGKTDCEDYDCNNTDGCEFDEEDTCDDGFDNDADGKTDCEDSDCAAAAICEDPEATCDDGFDNDGDGLTDCLDQDCDLKSDCQFGKELTCDDELDNDGDGDTDCADSDCATNPACTGNCPDEDLGQKVGNALNTVASISGATDDFPATTCGDEGGVDLSYAWSALLAGCYEVKTQGSDFDTVLRVFATCGGIEQDCDDNSGTGTLSLLRVQAAAGDDFVFVVDANSSTIETGNVVLNINRVSDECVELTCNDESDNDADGFTDCLDEDCDGVDNCEYGQETSCGDGFDNDGDGNADCADDDCSEYEKCEDKETTCDDLFDNDGDGKADCADDDCSEYEKCELFEESCDDGFDNDGDGDIDCLDTNCDEEEVCTGHNCCVAHEGSGCSNNAIQECVCESSFFASCCEEGSDWSQFCAMGVTILKCGSCSGETNCNNELDDDQDGLTDCEDSDCYGNDPNCSHNCCETNEEGGCNNEVIADCVCSRDPGFLLQTPTDCCTEAWTTGCVIAATIACGAGCI